MIVRERHVERNSRERCVRYICTGWSPPEVDNRHDSYLVLLMPDQLRYLCVDELFKFLLVPFLSIIVTYQARDIFLVEITSEEVSMPLRIKHMHLHPEFETG